jgi:PAS domain S-box-containing protein
MARRVWGMGWALVGLAVFNTAGPMLLTSPSLRWLILALAGVAAGFTVLGLARAGHVVAGAWVLVVSLWLFGVGAALTAGGLDAPSMLLQVVFVTTAGLLLGWRTGVVAAGVSMVTVFAVAWGQVAGLVPTAGVAHTPWSRAWSVSGYIMAIAVLVGIVTDDMRRSRDQALRELEQRRETEAFLGEVIASAPSVFYALDEHGRFLRWNRQLEIITGRSADEVGRTGALAFVEESDRDALAGAIQAAFVTGSASLEARLLTADGPRDYVLTGRLVVGEQSRYMVGFGVDITERRRWELAMGALNEELDQRVELRTAQLEEALHALESFSYSVSHDLRTPLRAINGYATILESDFAAALGEEGGLLCDRICANTIRMGRLIDDLMRFSRLEHHTMDCELVDMGEIVSSVTADLSAAESGASVKWIIGAMPPVSGDEAMLRQVWANLLGNAVKFSAVRKQPHVQVSCQRRECEQVFAVRDNGVGFDQQYADKLFRVFERLHGNEFEGSGIGLAIVKRIVEAHGGSVWCEGEPGVGASFFFSLPDDGATAAG